MLVVYKREALKMKRGWGRRKKGEGVAMERLRQKRGIRGCWARA